MAHDDAGFSRKIRSILPCDGPWYARYADKDGKSEEYFKVIMWALIREPMGDDIVDSVMPIVVGDCNFPMEADYCTRYSGVYLLNGETEETVRRTDGRKEAGGTACEEGES